MSVSLFRLSFTRSVLALLALAVVARAVAQTSWTMQHQRTGGADLWGVTSGAGGLVAVGTGGTLLHSVDGATWTRRSASTDAWLTAVAYGNGRYIAVGDGALILSSADAIAWSVVAHSATSQRLNNVHFANNQFVAVGEGGTIITSSDGVAWRAASSGTTRWLRGLAFGAASETAPAIFGTPCWVATGQAGTLLISDNATTWRAVDSGTTADLESAVFRSGDHGHPVAGPGGGHALFVLAGADGTALLFDLNASDALPFGMLTSVQPLALGTAQRIRALASGPHYFFHYAISASFFGSETATPLVAVDEAGGAATLHGESMGDAWQRQTLPSAAPQRAGIYSASLGAFFFVGRDETILQRNDVFTGRLGNLATRGFVDQGEKTLVAGFVVRGAAPKRVLLRGVGPALSGFGITNALSRPVLTLFDAQGAVVATNAGWSSNADPAAVAAAAAASGAFTLAPNSADAALLLSLPPGLYTAQVAGAAGASGVALVEAYDLDAGVNGTARAINLSTRGQVASGENVLIGGLTVQGPAWRRVLVRGIGPGLAQFGVTGALADPRLDLTLARNRFDPRFSPTTFSAELSAAEAQRISGAFPPAAGDQVSTYLLPPGTYTFQLSSRSSATGVALLEIYDLGIPEIVR